MLSKTTWTILAVICVVGSIGNLIVGEYELMTTWLVGLLVCRVGLQLT